MVLVTSACAAPNRSIFLSFNRAPGPVRPATRRSGVTASHVGYKGCAPALTDVVGGQIPLAILSANLVAPHIKTGKLYGVGVSTAARYALMPQVPTFEEQGLKPLDFSLW
ncbi:MAG: hypothetical protein B7Y03_13185 [Polaromonas sp. 24-62-144]|nr:MAG: hypothetical protein B7Y54_12945 [Polaromonas sp. 35-63-240]OYY93026.1 MAG: hypothetical protein B7Y42_11880 [Polaromonas sp. 28-63-22]OYZ78997.1 MAG: hypothetical protein B7Y03_13185 [Polaromonas sp. 24-62-144]